MCASAVNYFFVWSMPKIYSISVFGAKSHRNSVRESLHKAHTCTVSFFIAPYYLCMCTL